MITVLKARDRDKAKDDAEGDKKGNEGQKEGQSEFRRVEGLEPLEGCHGEDGIDEKWA